MYLTAVEDGFVVLFLIRTIRDRTPSIFVFLYVFVPFCLDGNESVFASRSLVSDSSPLTRGSGLILIRDPLCLDVFVEGMSLDLITATPCCKTSKKTMDVRRENNE